MKTGNFTKALIPTSATHPGALLRDEIEYRGITPHELALWMDLDIHEVGVVLDGEKSISPEFAMKIEKTLGVDAYYWLRMQAKYDIDNLRIAEFKKHPERLNDTLSGSVAVATEPKSAYASLGKKSQALE